MKLSKNRTTLYVLVQKASVFYYLYIMIIQIYDTRQLFRWQYISQMRLVEILKVAFTAF